MSAVPVIKYSINDYLDIEASTGKQYEFHDGELFEVEGASIEHNQVLSNLFGDISHYLKGMSCKVFTSQLKVESKLNNSVTYPDITVVCGEIELSKQSKDIITNPTVIIEVVSPSTGDYDHGKKFRTYRALPSLKEYILISSVEVLIEKFTKQDNKMWLLEECKTLQSLLSISSIGLHILLADIYDSTNLPVYED